MAGPKYVLWGVFRIAEPAAAGLAVPLSELQISQRSAQHDLALLAERGVTGVLCEVRIIPKDAA